MLLRKAFTSLLLQKPIRRITVRELCEQATVNRGTFYSHYTDLYDLLEQMEAEMLSDFEAALSLLLTLNPSKQSLRKMTSGIFHCLKDNADLCAIAFSAHADTAFAQKLLRLGQEKYLKYYAGYFPNASEGQLLYFYAFTSNGCIGILQQWFSQEMRTPVEEIAQTAEEIILRGVGFLTG